VWAGMLQERPSKFFCSLFLPWKSNESKIYDFSC
jgi:hypothetical protein